MISGNVDYLICGKCKVPSGTETVMQSETRHYPAWRHAFERMCLGCCCCATGPRRSRHWSAPSRLFKLKQPRCSGEVLPVRGCLGCLIRQPIDSRKTTGAWVKHQAAHRASLGRADGKPPGLRSAPSCRLLSRQPLSSGKTSGLSGLTHPGYFSHRVSCFLLRQLHVFHDFIEKLIAV